MKNNGAFIVTGATGGLGSSLAEIALKNGFSVALIARTESNLIKLKKKLESSNNKAVISIHAVDLQDEAKVVQEMKKIVKLHGFVRALINNAGTWMGRTDIKKLNSGDIRTSLDLNFFSALNPTLALLKNDKRDSKQELAIINIGATSSLDAWLEVLPFCLAKGALRDFSRALARDMGPKGIHVAHCVIDGMLDNERTRGLNPKTPNNRFISTSALANDVLRIALQEKSCWTAEWDVRPYNESW